MKLIPEDDTEQINTAKEFINQEKQKFKEWEEDKLARQDAIDQAEIAATEKALLDKAAKDAAKETDKTAKLDCESQDCMKYIKDGLDGYCVPEYKDNESGKKNEDGTVKDCDETDGTSCCVSPGCIKKRKKYQREGIRNFRILILGVCFGFWIFVFFRYSDVYVRRFGGFLLWIHNLVRNKKYKPEPIVPDDQYGFHDNPNNEDGKKEDKLVHAGLWLVFASILLGLSIWSLVDIMTTGKVVLEPCEPDTEETPKNDRCSSNLIKETCVDGTHKCIKCSYRKYFNKVACRCVNNRGSTTSSSGSGSGSSSSNGSGKSSSSSSGSSSSGSGKVVVVTVAVKVVVVVVAVVVVVVVVDVVLMKIQF